jgi:hypothetical protein
MMAGDYTRRAIAYRKTNYGFAKKKSAFAKYCGSS